MNGINPEISSVLPNLLASMQPDEVTDKTDTPNPDKTVYTSGVQTPGKSGGEEATQSILGEAYTLSLGGGTVPLATDAQNQLLQQASSYDKFGRSTAKQTTAPNSEVADQEPNSTVTNLKILSPLNEIDAQLPFDIQQEDVLIRSTQNSLPVELTTPGEANSANTANTASADLMTYTITINTAHRDDNVWISYLSAQKTNSISEAEPSQAIPSSADHAEMLSVMPRQAEKVPRMMHSQTFTMAAVKNGDVNEQMDRAGLRFVLNLKSLPNAERMIYGSVATEPIGTMANLEKIMQLPYALYLFGPDLPKSPKGPEDSGGPLVFYKNGKPSYRSSSSFLRLSEAIKMACILHNLYYGGSGLFKEEVPWYRVYVRYALRYEIINIDDFPNYNDFATRGEVAYIFSNCVPQAELPVINDRHLLPDVDENTKFAKSIYFLYRAGILTGSDGSNFYPNDLLTRSEAASIIGRIATPADRKLLHKK